MRIGLLQHRIGIATRILTVDAFGQQVETWNEAVTVWAQVKEIQTDESQAYEVTQQKKRINITIRFKSGVTALDRITYAGNTFNVLSVINIDGKNTTMEIIAERLA